MKKLAILLILTTITFSAIGCGKGEVTDTSTGEQVEQTDTSTSDQVEQDEERKAKVIEEFTQKYEDEKTGLKFSLPADWKKQDMDMVAALYIIDEAGSNLSMLSESNKGLSLKYYNVSAMAGVKQIFKIDNIETTEEVLGKYDVMVNEYVANEEAKLKMLQIVLVEGDNSYIFTLTAIEDRMDNYKDILKDIVSTVDFN